MKLSDLKEKASKLLVFDKKTLELLEKDSNNLSANLKYWLKNREVLALKKGFYIFLERYEREADKNAYLEYIANQLLQPSYLSLEYVLDKYQLLSEPVRALTSVSSKSSREFRSEIGSWRYYFLPRALFLGYRIKYFQGQPVAEASKAKALFDYLYLRFRRGQAPDSASLEKLRINWESLTRKDRLELESYFSLLSARRWRELEKLIKKYVA